MAVHESELQSSNFRTDDKAATTIRCQSLRAQLISRASLAELEPGANFIRRISPSDRKPRKCCAKWAPSLSKTSLPSVPEKIAVPPADLQRQGRTYNTVLFAQHG